MELQNPVAVPQGPGALGCRICSCELIDRNDFNQHHKAPWHLYNMRRRSQQLPAVTLAEFERKVQLLRLARQYAQGFTDGAPLGGPQQGSVDTRAPGGPSDFSGATAAAFHAAVRCNRRGTAHLKRQPQHESAEEEAAPAATTTEATGATGATTADERVAAARAAAVAWRAALQQQPERCNLFEQMPAFPSVKQNLQFMKNTYGFFIPDEEYCTNPGGVIRCLWREQQHQPSCLFCCRKFRGIRAALQHMQQQRHFQLRWDEEQQDLLSRFYDYKKSYYDLMERLSGKGTAQFTGPDTPKDTESEEAATGETDDEDDNDWENCSSEDEGAEETEQQKLDAMLRARGWNCARVTDEGLLQLPNGQESRHPLLSAATNHHSSSTEGKSCRGT